MHEDFPPQQEAQRLHPLSPLPDTTSAISEGARLSKVVNDAEDGEPQAISSPESVETPPSPVVRHTGNVALAGAETSRSDEDQGMIRLVEQILYGIPNAGLFRKNQLLRKAFGTTGISPEVARQFWNTFDNHPSVFPTGSGFCTHKIIPPHLPPKAVDRFWTMDQAVDGIMDYFFDKYLNRPFPPSYLVEYAKETGVWPDQQDERDIFYRLLVHHPRNRLVDEELSSISEPGIKPYQREALLLPKRVELLYRTRREAVVVPRIFDRGDRFTPAEAEVLQEAVEQCPYFMPIDGYPAWEIIPPGGSRHEIEAAQAMAQTVVRKLEAIGASGDLDTQALVKIAKMLGYDDSSRRLTSMMVMYLRAHPRLEWRDGLFWMHDWESDDALQLPARPHLKDNLGRRFQQRSRRS